MEITIYIFELNIRADSEKIEILELEFLAFHTL